MISAVTEPLIGRAARSRREQHRRSRRDRLTGLAFVIPSFAFLAVFSVYPMVRTVALSFTNWDGMSNTAQNVGFANYTAALHDRLWWVSLEHGLFFVVMALIIMNGVGMALALAVDSLRRGRTVYRVIFYIPCVLSGIVVAVIWKWLYEPVGGPLNSLLNSIGLDNLAKAWLASPSTAIWAVSIASIWQGLGYPFLLYTAGLQNVSAELVDAARADGANAWQVFFHVRLPGVRHVVTLVNVLTILGAMQLFNIVLAMTNGGPGYATEVPVLHIYREAFQLFHFGYASALSVIFGVLLLLVSLVQMLISRRGESR